MRAAIVSIFRASRAKNHRSRHFIARHPALWILLLILGASVVSSVMVGARGESQKTREVRVQQQGTKSVAGVLNQRANARPPVHSLADMSSADHESLEAALFVNPPAPLARTAMAPRSSAMLGARPSNGDEIKQNQARQKGLQQDELSIQAGPQEAREQRKPREERLTKAHSFNGDLRALPYRKPVQRERPELEGPESNPTFAPGTPATAPTAPQIGGPSTPAPAPLNVFDGLDRLNWGAGSPPDTNGDVGPNYYIQTVNTSIGVFRKSDGFREAAFTFDTFMSQGHFGNLCDTNNFGDPVVLYDTFEGRWIITDFAFVLDGSGNVVAPAFQCIAASKSGDPIAGGWNFYSTQISDKLNDYPKLGIWPDGLYMSSNLFSFGAGSTFQGVRVWAFNKGQMYAGSPTVKIVTFDVGGGDFTIIPSNARLQTGTPPAGRPNLFISTQLYLNALTAYKFHVDWNSISLSTFTGPDTPISATSWPAFAAGVPQPGTATLLDSLSNRAMVQNQYTNFTGTESLWVSHTVRRAAGGFAAPRWYQVNVTGGTVAAGIPQAATWDPDGANVLHRWMPSLALDRAGNMAMGYSTSSSTAFPSIAYAGRLAGDPVNTFSKTEQVFFTGTASQTGSTRWGDYSAMTLDPDGCTFWYTNEYANPADQTFNHRWLTKFGSFRYSECTQVGAGGTISGTVTTNPGGSPIAGATVEVGARTTSTNGSGNYSFTSIPAGTYPSMTASFPGSFPASASSIVVTDGGTTTQDFSLATAAASACLTDTTQSDFLTGVSTNVDLNTSPGDLTLLNAPTVDQQNTAGTTTGTGFGTPNWTGQSFIPAVTGLLAKVDVQLFCNACTGASNLTLSVRNTSAGLPTGADLASATIPGFTSGSGTYYTATFGSPAILTSGTQYALILRPAANPTPAGSGLFWIRSSPSTYANGSRVTSTDSGGTWTADTTRDFNFKAYMQAGFAASGNLISSPRDANPSGGITAIWSTFSWNATVPANTSLKFQLAGSNDVNGPFNFVGPDGTAATFFTTSPVQISPQFYNVRFLEYKALFATTDSTVSPVLNDATTCFDDVDCSTTVATITPSPAAVCASSTGNTASGPAGMTAYAWGITNGSIVGSATGQSITYTAGASGTVTLSLTVTAPNGCVAANSVPVTINPLPPTPNISGTLSFCTGSNTTLSSDAASGNQWFVGGNPIGGANGQQYVASAAGSYTVRVTDGNGCGSAVSAPAVVVQNSPPTVPTVSGTTNGTGTQDQACPEQPLTLTATTTGATSYQWYQNGSPIGGQTSSTTIVTSAGSYTVTAISSAICISAQSAAYVVQNPTPQKALVTPSGPTTFCQGGSVTLQSDSATGIQWYLDGNPIGGATHQNYVATGSGTYTAILNALGCHSQTSDPIVVTVNPTPPAPTITPGGPTTFCAGGSVTLTASSATGNQWYLNGNPIGGATNQTYSATATGNYTDVVTSSGCPSASSAATTVTVNPIPATPTITPGGPTTFCAGGSVTLTSSSATGNQWYLNGNPIGGATNQAYVATASGAYTVTDTANGCVSAPSSLTSVTVNPIPATPTITPSGPTTFFVGGSVTLMSSSASGNQWYLNGNPIGGATNQNYIATASGDYTARVTTSGCPSPPSAAVTVTVNPFLPPSISKLFLPDTVVPNGTTLLSFTISNPNDDPNINMTLNGIAFTDNLPAGLVIASPNELSNTCGGIVMAAPGSSSISLSGGTLATAPPLRPNPLATQAITDPAAGTCFITVKVKAPVALGILDNTTGPITSNESGPGAASNTASLTVVPPPLPAIIAKAFGVSIIPLNGTTSLTFSFINPNTTRTLVNVSASDVLPVGLLVANPRNLAGSCGGDIIANPGSTTIGISALNLPPSSSCTFSVDVTGSGAGTKNNTTGNVTAFYDDGTGDFVTIIGGTATATIQVLKGNQTITFGALPNKTFGDADFSVSATTTSGLTVGFAASGQCTVVGTNIHLTGAGSCVITASQSGDTNYNAATSVPQSFTIAQSNQTISFAALANKNFGDPDFAVGATTTSGLAVSFAASGQCTIAGTVVHLTGVGSCTVTASQGGDTNYNAATNVTQSFNIVPDVTTTAVSSSINPSDLGESVTFTATITPPLNTSTPTGSVQFKDGSNNLGSAASCAAVAGNTCTAQFTTSTLTTGTHVITASYSGDANFVGSTGTLSGGQVVTSQPALQLILEESNPDPNHAAALDSMLLLRDPFPVHSVATWLTLVPDRNTRVMVFVANLHLNSGETADAIVVNLVDSNNQSYDVPAEDVRLNPITGFAQVTFRLPDTLFTGVCTIKVKAHGHVSNSATIQIGP